MITLEFKTPIHGWLRVLLTGPNGRIEFVASHVGVDPLEALATVARNLAKGSDAGDVTWFLEPETQDWKVRANGDEVDFYALDFADEGPVFAHLGRQEWCTVVWQALRKLESNPIWKSPDVNAAWMHPFPTQQVARLGEELGKGSRS